MPIHTGTGNPKAASALVPPNWGRFFGSERNPNFCVMCIAVMGSHHDLIPAAVGAYSENGPVGAAINPRRVRLIARRR